MRSKRETLLSPKQETESAIYHCVSRVVDRDFKFGAAEKEEFVKCMRMYEAFGGLQVLSYCVMSNHFHVLVKIPPLSEQEISDEELIRRMKPIYSVLMVADVERKLKDYRKNHATKARRKLREKFTKRMCNLSDFMKMLKWRFSTWFNSKHGRVGTLWESRFKSVLVEDGVAARTMAAYIDLNPVRAGMVSDPKDYRWCSYAEALGSGEGAKLAKAGVEEVMDGVEEGQISHGMAGMDARKVAAKTRYDSGLKKARRRDQELGQKLAKGSTGKGAETAAGAGSKNMKKLTALERYRVEMFEDAEEQRDASGKVVRRGYSDAEVRQILKKRGKLSKVELLRCKTRYFTDGAVLGTKAFVEGFFQSRRDLFSEKRSSGARKMKGVEAVDGESLHTLRDLRKDVLGGS